MFTAKKNRYMLLALVLGLTSLTATLLLADPLAAQGPPGATPGPDCRLLDEPRARATLSGAFDLPPHPGNDPPQTTLPLQPAIAVEPLALGATLYPGQRVTYTLWITNAGTKDLDVSLRELSRTQVIEAGPTFRPRAEPVVVPEVWAQVRGEGRADVIVYLRELADLSPAYAQHDWQARGRFVYERLVETARRCAGPLYTWLAANGAQPRLLWATDAIAASVDATALDTLAARPEVARVGLDLTLPVLPSTEDQLALVETVEWNIARIGADRVWATLGISGTGVTVGNVGTGVLYTHPALVKQYRGNLGGGAFDHNYNWFDLINFQPQPYDDNGHSTFTTGVMVGDDALPGGRGGVNQIGIAPGATWITVKALDGGSATLSNLHIAMGWMLAPWDLSGGNNDPDKRPHIGLNAWNWGSCNTEFQPDLQAWLASGILPVTRAGGGGPACNTMNSPGDLPEGFGAASTTPADGITSWSSRGPSCWGQIKPEVAAPGVSIRSSYNDGGYVVWDTAAGAAAHLAGTAALVLSANPNLDPIQVQEVITGTALCLEDLTCGGAACPDGANNTSGWGLIDAFAAVSLTVGGPSYDLPWLSETPTSGTLAPGDDLAVAVTFDASGQEPGQHLGLLDVASNDPATPHLGILVTMTVRPPCDPVTGTVFAWQPLTPTVGALVTFSAEATGTGPISFGWAFGDGSLAHGTVPTHTYAHTGTYTVLLTTTNLCGQETVARNLSVADLPPQPQHLYLYLPLVLRESNK